MPWLTSGLRFVQIRLVGISSGSVGNRAMLVTCTVLFVTCTVLLVTCTVLLDI